MFQCRNCEETFATILAVYRHLIDAHNIAPNEAFTMAMGYRPSEGKDIKIDENEKLVG